MPLDKTEKVVLEWKYTPPDFLRAPFARNNDNYEIEIDNGQIRSTTSSEFYDSDENARIIIHKEIIDLFLGAQTTGFKSFKISKPTVSRTGPDDRLNFTVFLTPLVSHGVLSDKIELIVKNKNGNIIEDSKSNRIKAERCFAELAAKHNKTDKIARSILNSFNNAVNDPPNEFIHLFEILESLCRRFDNEKKLRDVLGISRNRIRQLRILSNTEPLLQGRHRGRNIDGLRDATNQERDEARSIARELIHNYFEYIDTK